MVAVGAGQWAYSCRHVCDQCRLLLAVARSAILLAPGVVTTSGGKAGQGDEGKDGSDHFEDVLSDRMCETKATVRP